MLRGFFSNPLLVRELVSGARKPSKERATYPGLGWVLGLCGLIAVLFIMFGERSNVFLSCRWFIVAAWMQTWLLWRRSGAYAASSIAGPEERLAFAVAQSSPCGLGQALLAKLAGAIMPLALEMLLLLPINAAVYMLWGSVPCLLFLEICLLQAAMILGGAGLGLLLGLQQSDSAKASRLYRSLATFIAVLGMAMCYGPGWGRAVLTVFALYVLLVFLPDISETFSTFSGVLATLMIVALPFSFIVDITPIYNCAKNVNPFVALWKVQPVDLSNTRALYYSKLATEDDFYHFASDCYSDLTGAEKLAASPRWLEAFAEVINSDAQIGSYVNNMYFRWRSMRLLGSFLGLLVMFLACMMAVRSNLRRSLRMNSAS